MKPPSCRICHADHWPREPHVWQNGADKASPKSIAVIRESAKKFAPCLKRLHEGDLANTPPVSHPPVVNKVANTAAEVANKPHGLAHRKGDRQKYNARQREYMRLKRAK